MNIFMGQTMTLKTAGIKSTSAAQLTLTRKDSTPLPLVTYRANWSARESALSPPPGFFLFQVVSGPVTASKPWNIWREMIVF